MGLFRWSLAAFNWSFRATIVLALACYPLVWPFAMMGAGATLEHPEDGYVIALISDAQVLLALASLCGFLFLHDRRWYWGAAGSVAFWLPCFFVFAEARRTAASCSAIPTLAART